MLTCCASLAAAAASPVSTDATRAPSLTGRSCLGRVGVTRANIEEAATKNYHMYPCVALKNP